jgi:hypothetical protein
MCSFITLVADTKLLAILANTSTLHLADFQPPRSNSHPSLLATNYLRSSRLSLGEKSSVGSVHTISMTEDGRKVS